MTTEAPQAPRRAASAASFCCARVLGWAEQNRDQGLDFRPGFPAWVSSLTSSVIVIVNFIVIVTSPPFVILAMRLQQGGGERRLGDGCALGPDFGLGVADGFARFPVHGSFSFVLGSD